MLRRLLCLLPLAAVLCWLATHRALLGDGARAVLRANGYGLLAAFATTALGWVAVSFARQGTVPERLPARRLLATQVAAASANHLLPSGIGAGAVNVRFLARCGVPAARYPAALALYLLAEGVSRLALLLAVFAVFPGALRPGALSPDLGGVPPAAVLAVVLLALALPVPFVAGRARRAVRRFLAHAFADIRSVHARPARALALWGGSLAFPLLQAAGLVAVALSLGLGVPAGHVVLAYLAASVLAAAVPSPGGIGSVDASLVLALAAIGAPVGAATSTVLAYRTVTVWLPLLPGALLLGALVRRRVV
ncbi:lysylphosphatidylglycerol synthase transmembrane domain-containing protein [Streptomyces hoynatensis]|uniref:TIGR00374 family protein n=1 Tax=Streptomyces hoynatensis TaxID=1141874 RepID=A0A3A9YLH7_9ACTN|nr:lysylphosphatidylglycerol synthase domain-containing protein [Streptomyces hoynatensis]RKN37089.1 TIGR00374 family protein [Streptomyces hoynatensis]